MKCYRIDTADQPAAKVLRYVVNGTERWAVAPTSPVLAMTLGAWQDTLAAMRRAGAGVGADGWRDARTAALAVWALVHLAAAAAQP